MIKRKSRYSGRNRGQSFVELAIVLPVLLFLLIGFVEVGGSYLFLSVHAGCRQGSSPFCF